MITGLDHVQLAMPAGQEEKARAFYGLLLGFKEIEKPEPLKARGGVWFQGEGFGLHLGVMKDFRPATKAHPAFRVTNIETLFKHLEDTKLEPKWDDKLVNTKRFYVNDPFDNRLEFLTVNSV